VIASTLRRFGLALMIVELKRFKDEERELRLITFCFEVIRSHQIALILNSHS